MRDALATLDQNRRKADYKIVQQQMALDVPTIVLYFWKDIYIYNTDLQGLLSVARDLRILESVGVFDLKKQLAAALALGLLAAGCSKVSTAGNGRVNAFTQPHVLRFADAGDVNTLNPHLGQFSAVGHIASVDDGVADQMGSE